MASHSPGLAPSVPSAAPSSSAVTWAPGQDEALVPHNQMRRGIEQIGYRGWIMIEQWLEVPGQKPLGFDETHRRNLQYLRTLFPPSA